MEVLRGRHFLEPDLQGDPVGLDLARTKTAVGDQALKSTGGIGAVSEPAQDPARDETVHGAKSLVLHLAVDIGGGRLLPEVLDHGPATWSQNAVDLVQGTHRSLEIL